MRSLAAAERVTARTTWVLSGSTVLFVFVTLAQVPEFPSFAVLAASAIMTLAAVRPADALLVTTGFLPLLPISGDVLGIHAPLTELVVVALLAGNVFRLGRPIPDLGIERPVRLFLIVVLGATVVALATTHVSARSIATGQSSPLSTVYANARDLPQWTHARLLIEGPMLLAATFVAIRCEPSLAIRVVRMFVAGAAGAAALNIQRVAGVALRSDAPIASVANVLRSVRVNVHYGDVNAAGSYFALMLPLAAVPFLAASRHRVLWASVAILIAVALWLTGARAAVAASILVLLGAIVAMAARKTPTRVWPLLVAFVVSLVVLVLATRGQLLRSNAATALMLRAELAQMSLRMFATEPIFGVGIGRFYDLSGGYVSDWLRTYYPKENAHNQFLQVMSEMGAAGLVPFVWVVGAGYARTLRTVRAGVSVWWGVLGGISAFLLTCFVGHPLLTPVVAYAFWTVLGLAAAAPSPASSEPTKTAGRWTSVQAVAPLAVTLALALSIPFRVRSALGAVNLERTHIGISPTPVVDDGQEAFPVTLPMAFYVRRDATTVELQLRHTAHPDQIVLLDIWINGEYRDRIAVAGNWRRQTLQIPAMPRDVRYVRFELRAPSPSAEVPGLLTRHIGIRSKR
jgi:O-antigen ligase